MPPPHLSVVVPVYNEAGPLPHTVRQIRDTLEASGRSWEIVIVSDGSTDDVEGALAPTLKEEPRCRLILEAVNRGKGAAVRRGIFASRGTRVLFTDADLAAPIEEVAKLNEALDGGADVAIGSRRVEGASIEVRQGPLRRLTGGAFPWLVRGLTGLSHADTQCGFKLFTRAAAETLFGELQEQRFAFDVEILSGAHEAGLRVAEVPVVWRDSGRSSVRLVRDSLRMMRTLLKLADPRRHPRIFGRQMTIACLLGVLLLALFRVGTIGVPPLYDNTEGRYGSISLTMHRSGDWVTPRVNRRGEMVPFMAKPPLDFWLTAASFRLFGVSDAAALVPADDQDCAGREPFDEPVRDFPLQPLLVIGEHQVSAQ
ncbi:MAG: glycosyltransferase [Planctomycetota bacterium]